MKRVTELQIRDVAVTPAEAQCIEEAVTAYCQAPSPDRVKWIKKTFRVGDSIAYPSFSAEWNGLRLFVGFSNAFNEWSWSVVRAGELPYQSRHGVNTAQSAVGAKKRAEQAARELFLVPQVRRPEAR